MQPGLNCVACDYYCAEDTNQDNTRLYVLITSSLAPIRLKALIVAHATPAPPRIRDLTDEPMKVVNAENSTLPKFRM